MTSLAISIEKPELTADKRLSLDGSLNYLGATYNFNPRHVNCAFGAEPADHYKAWCRKHKHPVNPKEIKMQQDIFSLYCDAPDGLAAEPTKEDARAWLVDIGRVFERVSGKTPKTKVNKERVVFELPMNVDIFLDKFDDSVAPVLAAQQAAVAVQMEAVIASGVLDSAYNNRIRLQHKPQPNTMPEYVRKVLKLYKAEFGNGFYLYIV